MEENQDIPADCLIILVLEGEQGRLAGTILLCGTPSPRDCSSENDNNARRPLSLDSE